MYFGSIDNWMVNESSWFPLVKHPLDHYWRPSEHLTLINHTSHLDSGPRESYQIISFLHVDRGLPLPQLCILQFQECHQMCNPSLSMTMIPRHLFKYVVLNGISMENTHHCKIWKVNEATNSFLHIGQICRWVVKLILICHSGLWTENIVSQRI